MARPWKYNRNVSDQICQMVSNGLSLREACRRLHLAPGTVCGWAAEDVDGFAARLRTAQDAAYTLLETDILETSRQARGLDMAGVQACKLETDVARWFLARRQAHYFGDRVEHSHLVSGGVTVYVPSNNRQLPQDDLREIDGTSQELLEDGSDG